MRRNLIIRGLSAMIIAITLATACDDDEKTVTPPDPDEKPVVEIVNSPADSRWELSSSLCNNSQFSWFTEGKCYATNGEGRDKAFFTAVSESGSDISFEVKSGGAAAGNMHNGDYLLFCVPMKSLPAGTDVDFMATFFASSTDAPRDWQFEYMDGGEWKADGEPFIVQSGTSNNTTVVRTFTTATAIEQDTLKIRCRVCSETDGSGMTIDSEHDGCIYLVPKNFQSCRILTYPADRFPAATDSLRIMALGNSFSYYSAPVWMFKEIARSQGHYTTLNMNVKGSQTFANHLGLTLSQRVINEGGYDYALLQDQSTQHAKYAKNPSSNSSILDDTQELKDDILKKSPSCKVILENTWSYSASSYAGYGSYDSFDNYLVEGCKAIAKQTGCTRSPICEAFAKARKAGFDLYFTDSKHQGDYGAYLKACVDYLVVYGGAFYDSTSDCNLPARAAERLREIAQSTVDSQTE